MATCGSLRVLDISDCKLIANVAALAMCDTLECLVLGGSGVTDSSMIQDTIVFKSLKSAGPLARQSYVYHTIAM